MSLEEVAKRAGVSTATVSRVLNNAHLVKHSTRTRVMSVIEELNYHPNLHARTLAGGRSRTLGMIVSHMENPFFFDIYRTLEASADEHGYEVVIVNTDYRPDRLVRGVRQMIGRRVAGLAVVVSEMDPELMSEVAESGIPAVFYDVGAPQGSISKIRANYSLGIRRVVEYLRSLGHQRLAFVGHHVALGPTSERERAFVEAVSRHAPAVQWHTVADQDGLDGGRQAARELLDSGFDPTAIVCVNDFMAVGVLRELRDRGLRVPQDVSVTGFDNIRLSEYSYPPLTTVQIPRDRIGRLAFQMLVPDKDGRKPPGREIVIDPELVLRDSTGPVAAPVLDHREAAGI